MRRFTNLGIAISGGLLLALAFGSPAAAATLIKQSGVHGDWGTRSSADGPEANCNYTSSGGGANTLTSIKVFPVLAGHSPMLLQQKVSWTVSIQKHPFSGGGTWKTIATSQTQTVLTRNATSSPFSAITVSVTGKLDWKYRAVSTVHWLISGSSTGMVKFSMDTYGLKFGSTPVTIIAEHSCSGVVLD
jgi:predicted secreted protein